MSDSFEELDAMGPIDFLVIEFPRFALTGEAFGLLVDLVDRNIVRVLDLVFVSKNESGETSVTAGSEFQSDGELDFSVFDGARSGLLSDDDIQEAGEALMPGNAGAILVYENLWAAPLARALRRQGGQLVAGGRIPVQALLAAIEDLERVSS